MEISSNAIKPCSKDHIKGLAKKQGYGFIESFSGPGGISLGMERAGFSLLFAFDANLKAVETHNANQGPICIVADARAIMVKDLLKRIGMTKGELPLFTGGPPCQGFSKQRRGAHYNDGDERNDLVLEYVRLVSGIEPRFFLFENVAIFGQKRGQDYLKQMLKSLSKYEMYPHFYNSADYGLAQTRQRFIIIGRRYDQNSTFQIPKPTVKKWKTVGEVLKDLPEPPTDYTDHPKYPNHQRARVTPINIKRFSHVPQGGGWQSIPKELRIRSHKIENLKSGGWPDVYGRLDLNGQCPTITGGFDSFTRGRYGHPFQDRPITPREAARLQGFPDSYIFYGNRGDIRSQIGNAVPPPLAEALGMEIIRSLLCADGVLEDHGLDSKHGRQLNFAFA